MYSEMEISVILL